MTTIAYRDGIMVGDSAITSSGVLVGQTRKVVRRDDGSLCGVCGAASMIGAISSWFLARELIASRPKFGEDEAQALIVRPDGSVTWLDYLGVTVLAGPFSSIGSGRDIALGAMAAGATAQEAVRIAAKLDCHTGGKIVTVRLGAAK